MSHTPGPWKPAEKAAESFLIASPINPQSSYWECAVISGVRLIAVVRGGTPEEAIANARMVAAAPDLLEALKGLVEPDRSGRHLEAARQAARAAIAKAEAPPEPEKGRKK
jgi:hypothetical protein